MRLGPYEIEGEVGRGGSGLVFRARSLEGRVVAIKLLQRRDPAALGRFERERRLQASFGEGEGFVPLLDLGDAPQGPYIVMPYLSAGSLRDRLPRGPLAVAEAVALVRRPAGAGGRAPARGIVHRDLKPENVPVSGEAPLRADLGLAQQFRGGLPG